MYEWYYFSLRVPSSNLICFQFPAKARMRWSENEEEARREFQDSLELEKVRRGRGYVYGGRSGGGSGGRRKEEMDGWTVGRKYVNTLTLPHTYTISLSLSLPLFLSLSLSQNMRYEVELQKSRKDQLLHNMKKKIYASGVNT